MEIESKNIERCLVKTPQFSRNYIVFLELGENSANSLVKGERMQIFQNLNPVSFYSFLLTYLRSAVLDTRQYQQ